MGWDVGKLVKGYEKYVVVEGSRDKLVLDQCFKKLKGEPPENIWITIIPSRGFDNLKEVVKAILPLEREIFVLPDLDRKSQDERRLQLIDSLKTMSNEGYEVKADNIAVTFSKAKMATTIDLKNIIPLGDLEGLSKKGISFVSHSMDDYLLELVLDNLNKCNELGIAVASIEDIKKCSDSKSAINMMELNDEMIEKLIQDCPLPDSLRQIVELISSNGHSN